MATTELVFKIRTDSADFKSTMAQVRAELNQTAKTQQNAAKIDIASAQQAKLAQFLHRRELNALVTQYKQNERAAALAASGTKSFRETLDGLSRSIATMQGPLGGVAGRISSLGSLTSGLTGSISGATVAAGAAVAVLGAMAVGAGVLASKIFEATKQTAEWQGKLFDLSQQTGVSVETLSALDTLAATTGSSIEAISASLGIFQRNLEDAQDPTSKEAALLKNLGVETNNTEQALRQTLTALSQMPEGFQQTALALELFGRGGKAVLAILKETNGDLDGAIDRFRDLGILLDTDASKAADEFNDSLEVVHRQIRGLVAIIGNEAMPTILRAIQQVTQFITDNRVTLQLWADDFRLAANGALAVADALASVASIVTGLSGMPVPLVLRFLAEASFSGGPLQSLLALGALTAKPTPSSFGPLGVGESDIFRRKVPKLGGGGRGGGGRGRTERDTFLQDAIKAAELAEREALEAIETNLLENRRALEEQVRSIEEFTARAIELENKQLDATLERITAEQIALSQAFQKKLISKKEFETKSRELSLETEQVIRENSEAIFKREQERDLKLSQTHLAAKQRELQIAEEADARQINRIEDRVNRELLLESEGLRQVQEIVEEGFERRKRVLEDELIQYATTLERRAAINDELIRLDGERADAAVEASKRIIDAQRQEFLQQSDPERTGFPTTRPRSFEQDQLDLVSSSQFTFEQFGKVMGDTFNLGIEQAQEFGNILSSTFGQVAEAVGSAVKAFVLFGGAQGSFKKFAAEVIASIAQMAAVQAVFELAQGLAMLALNFFFPNPKYAASAATHFKAAAIFGGIALVSAGVGRAVAGNSFAEGGGGGGGEGPPQSVREGERDRTITEGRRGGAAAFAGDQVIGRLAIDIKHDEGAMETRMVRIYKRNGEFRATARGDMLQEPNAT